MSPNKRPFFSKMRIAARYDCQTAGTTSASFIFQSINLTLARAEMTILQNPVRLFCDGSQLALLVGLYVGRNKHYLSFSIIIF